MTKGKSINHLRRSVLKRGAGAALLSSLAAAGIVLPRMAMARWDETAFRADNLAAALKALGADTPANSRDIRITCPEVAENGAAVSVGVESALPKVSMLAILVEKNPNVLAARFILPEGIEPHIQTRLKIAQSSNVCVLVKSDGRFFMASREVTVIVGGCG